MKHWRVLIAAGDETLARLCCRRLRDAPSFEAVSVSPSAPAARAAARLRKPDVIVLDLDLPGGALTLLRQLRAEATPVEAIAITGSGEARAVQAALRLGAVDCLVKPFTAERLRRALALCRRRMAIRAAGRFLTQDEIDALTRGHPGRWLPRGVEPRRLEQVRAALKLRGAAMTAEAVAAAIGAERTTARRYLEYLVTVGEATVEELPAGPGRPPKAYSAQDALAGAAA